MALAPEMESPRAHVDARLAVCSAASIAVTAACLVFAARRAPAPVIATPVLVPLPVLQPPRVEVVTPEPDPPPHVVAGTSDLARFVDAWLTDPDAAPPAIEYRRGVVYIESAEDRGDDGPYPRSADPEAQRVCGSAAVWLRDHLRARLAWAEATCTEDECTYAGMEYVPNGRLTFRKITRDGQPAWALVAWTQTYTQALGQEYAQANRAFVAGATKRLADTSCPGEPEGAY